MHFLLSSMSVVYVLTTPMPEDGSDDPAIKQVRKRNKWDNDDYVCRELWDSLKAKYMAKDASSKKFLVSCIIDKLPPSWKDFKHTLKHKKEELTLVELGSHLRIKESLRAAVVRLPDLKLKTLGERVIECIFVGYAEHSKAFRFYVIEPNDSILVVQWPPEEVTEEVVQQLELELRKSKRNRNPKNFGPEFQLYLIEGTKDEDVAFWKEAINDEMDSIMGNNTWVLADLPPGCKPLGCRWIFKRKLKVDGTIEKFKARLVIQGFKQKSRIDYFDAYALTTFLNGEFDEEVYMNQPQGFIMPDNENKVCKLIKSLYGLKQAPKQWHQKFDEVVLSNGYLLNQADKCVYSKFDETGKGDMGEADVIFGIRIKHESNGIAISQSHYIEKVLKKFSYFNCTPVSNPMDTSEKLMPNNGQAVSQLEYSKVIGCLMYVMTCTRPDIAFVVGKQSRYTSNPGTQHWQAIQRASKKQTCITGSTMESEFMALVAAGKEAEWLRNLILEILL
ncbi:zinc finger, CCHC-type containing protein [Tanacetum coccineum]